MATRSRAPLAPPAGDSSTTPANARGPAQPMVGDIMTARWRCHVIAARAAGVSREHLERELRQMATQLDALYQDRR